MEKPNIGKLNDPVPNRGITAHGGAGSGGTGQCSAPGLHLQDPLCRGTVDETCPVYAADYTVCTYEAPTGAGGVNC